MSNEPIRKVVRIDRAELFDLPAHWSARERGRHLRLLLHSKGIDGGRLFRTEYHPHRRCWLLTQERAPGPVVPPAPGEADERFYRQAMAEFRRAGVTAWAAVASQSGYFARFGRPFEAPAAGQELTPSDLAALLRGPGEGGPSVSFDGEGGWEAGPSAN